MKNFNIAGNFNARMFVFEDGVLQCGAEPLYLESAAIDSLNQDRGDITKVERPSQHRYGEFEEVYSFSGELSRVSTTLNTYMSRVSRSTFFSLFSRDCSFDIHIHFGECQIPSDFRQFDKALILEDVRSTSWSTDPVQALTSGDKGVIKESIDISASRIIELVNLQYSEVANAVTVDGAFVKGVVADTRSCGGYCNEPSDGCQRQFAVTDDGYLYYSSDGGTVWAAQQVVDVVTNTTSIPVDIMVVADSIIIVTADSMLYVGDRTNFLLDPVNTNWDVIDVSTYMTVTAADSAYNIGAVVAEAGVIGLVDIYGELTIVEQGNLTTENLSTVDVHDSGTILVGGANGVILYSPDDGVTWLSSNSPTTDSVTSVLVKSDKSWLVGTSAGELWCTGDYGVNWAQVTYPGWNNATTPVLDIQANSTHTVYMLQNNRLLKSIDGGTSWVVEPSNSKKAFPTMVAASIVPCWDNINTLTVVGSNGGSGAIVLGTPIS